MKEKLCTVAVVRFDLRTTVELDDGDNLFDAIVALLKKVKIETPNGSVAENMYITHISSTRVE